MLFRSALKFSPPSTAVVVDVAADFVSVTDRRSGIAEPEKSNVFERFYSADSTRSLPGSGLGLAIVKQFADDHGASVDVLDAPGGGTTMRMRFSAKD